MTIARIKQRIETEIARLVVYLEDVEVRIIEDGSDTLIFIDSADSPLQMRWLSGLPQFIDKVMKAKGESIPFEGGNPFKIALRYKGEV